MVYRWTLIISGTSSKVKVLGQISRSPYWKMWFSKFWMVWPVQIHFDITWHHLTLHEVTARCHMVTSQHNITILAEILTRGAWCKRGIYAQAFSLIVLDWKVLNLEILCHTPLLIHIIQLPTVIYILKGCWIGRC